MNNYFKPFMDDLKRLWSGLDLGQKFGLVTLSALTLVIATYFLIKSTEPNWTVLYSDLAEADSIAISESLKKSGNPYKISKDKTTILVPSQLQDELRIYVAENNLITDSSPGFELLDNLQLGSTDFKNKLTKQRIFQGELTRSIEKMSGVKRARVQLAEPERSVFQDKDEEPTASVMLILEPGYRLKSNQVKAIKNLVAYSIPRMDPEKVFITDQNGNNLTDEVNKNSTDMESFKLNLEEQTAKKVQTVLDKIVGRNNANVQVSADLDFNSTRSTIESYIPVDGSSQGVLASSQSESELYQKPDPNAPVAADAENPAPDTVVGPAQNAVNSRDLNYQKEKNATNYNVSKEIKQVIYAPGTIKRMTIAVAVNKVLTDTEKEELQNLVISASGANLTRGDIINITSLQFASLAEEQARAEAMKKELAQDNMMSLIFDKIAPLLVVFVLGLVALIVLKSLWPKGSTIVQTKESSSSIYDDYGDDYQSGMRDDLSDMMDIDPLPQIEAKLDPELERIKSDLAGTILTDPAEASRLLISYIKD